MRRFARYILPFLLVLFPALSLAQEKVLGVQPEVIGFGGKLVNHGPSRRLKSEDFTSMQNWRFYENAIGTRKGTANWTSNADPHGLSVVELIPHFTDTEQHIIAATASTSGVTYYKVENGSFSLANKLYSTTGTTATPITHAKVRDTVYIADVGGVTAYSGNSVFPTALLVEYENGVFTDRYDWIYGDQTNTVASGNTVWVGYSRPFDRFQSSQNSSMDLMASGVTEYLRSGKMRYWLSYVTTGNSSFYKPKIECLPRTLSTSWDGKSELFPQVAGVHITGTSEFQDYTLMVRNGSEESPMDISQLQSGGTIYFGFLQRPRLVRLFFPETYKNNVVSSVSGYYWNGQSKTWTVCPSFSDGTSSGGVAFKQTGIVDFDKITNWDKRKVGQSPHDVYALAFKVSNTISNYVRIFKVTAIPDYDNPSTVGKFKGVATANNRLYLYNGRDKTKLLVSAENQPDCFIGPDANSEMDNPIVVGKQENFMHVGALGENVLIMKETENFIKSGVNPNTFTVKPLKGTAPCIATKSVAVVEYGGSVFAYYLAKGGFRSIDAAGNNPSISDEIRGYFEKGNTLAFPESSLQYAKGWFDYENLEYHCIINNTELVYSPVFKKWNPFDRSLGVQTGTYFVDNNKASYHLLGGTGGTIFQAETGTSDYGQPIISDFTKPPIVLGNRLGTQNELLDMTLRYETPDGAVTGNTLYLTGALGSGVSTYNTTFDLADADWKFFNIYDVRSAVKGYTHKIRMSFRGRVNLDNLLVRSREIGWNRTATTAASGATSAPAPPAPPAPAAAAQVGFVFQDETGGNVFQDEVGGNVFHDY